MALNGARLFCFDFDETITQRHMHHFLKTCGVKPGMPIMNEIIEICLESCKLKNPDLTREAIKKIINQGDLAAIVSYNCYPDMINYTLKKLGLSESELAKIRISTGFPTEEGSIDPTGRKKISYAHGKELHIADCVAWAKEQGFSIANEDIILIDDDQKNIEIAKQHGHKAIQVPKIDKPLDFDYLIVALSHYIGEYDPELVAKCKADLAIDMSNIALIEKLSSKQRELDDRYEAQLKLINMLAKPGITEESRREQIENLLRIKSKRYLYGELTRLCCRHKLIEPTFLIQFDRILEEASRTKETKALLTEKSVQKIKKKILGI